MKDISSLDILVHPGFGTLINMPENNNQGLLLERYRERIEEISQDSRRMLVIVLFMPEAIKAQNPSRRVRPIAELIAEAKRMLEERYCEISAKNIMSEIDEDPAIYGPFYDNLRLHLNAKGVAINPHLPVYAWGQTIGSCVPNVAANFHQQFKMAEDNPVSIPMFYTNRGVGEGEINESDIQRYLHSYSERVQKRISLTIH